MEDSLKRGAICQLIFMFKLLYFHCLVSLSSEQLKERYFELDEVKEIKT